MYEYIWSGNGLKILIHDDDNMAISEGPKRHWNRMEAMRDDDDDDDDVCTSQCFSMCTSPYFSLCINSIEVLPHARTY
jgi:hypothetical protein